ncbi:DUF6059 family protein [Streptomyces niveus]|uniref:DUF6059 family protein n=1 Tax=Streptomyces niveus TaxID=193462 RepID=UPI00369EC6B6
MGLWSWLRRACDSVWNMLVEYGAIAVGPLPGVNYPDPDPAPNHPPQQPAHGRGNGDRLQDPPTGHPERRCATPPSLVEQELWAGLGVDVRKAGR